MLSGEHVIQQVEAVDYAEVQSVRWKPKMQSDVKQQVYLQTIKSRKSSHATVFTLQYLSTLFVVKLKNQIIS